MVRSGYLCVAVLSCWAWAICPAQFLSAAHADAPEEKNAADDKAIRELLAGICKTLSIEPAQVRQDLAREHAKIEYDFRKDLPGVFPRIEQEIKDVVLSAEARERALARGMPHQDDFNLEETKSRLKADIKGVYRTCIWGERLQSHAANCEAELQILGFLDRSLADKSRRSESSTQSGIANGGQPIARVSSIDAIRERVTVHSRRAAPIKAAVDLFRPLVSGDSVKPADKRKLRPAREEPLVAKTLPILTDRLNASKTGLRAASVRLKRRVDQEVRHITGDLTSDLDELLKLDLQDRNFSEDEGEKHKAARKKRIKESLQKVEKGLATAQGSLQQVKSLLVAVTVIALVDPEATKYTFNEIDGNVEPKEEDLPKSVVELKAAADRFIASMRAFSKRHAHRKQE